MNIYYQLIKTYFFYSHVSLKNLSLLAGSELWFINYSV